MTTDLTRFDRGAQERCATALRAAMAETSSIESAARAMCRQLHADLTSPTGERAAVMVRCYTTHRFAGLPPDLQRFARRALGAVSFSPVDPAMQCLVLLATAGDEPAWNDRRASVGHQAIPLPSPHIVERAPMIAGLIQDLGFDIATVVRQATSSVRQPADGGAGIFHVEEAAGSRYIPAQDFVERYAVRSVLGFGGALPGGDILATIIFSRVRIPFASADRFRGLATEMLRALATHEDRLFDESPAR